MSHIDPIADQLRALSELGQDTPVTMLNLLRFRDEADYSGYRTAAIADSRLIPLTGDVG